MNEEIITVTDPTPAIEAPRNPVDRVVISKVDNGFLVESQDRNWHGGKTVHLDLDSALEVAKNAF